MTFAYDAANRIKTLADASGLTTYAYDANGNLLTERGSGGTTTNMYDNENRLVRVQTAVGVSTYMYDGDGLRRTAQEAGASVVTTFIWDGSDYLGEYAG